MEIAADVALERRQGRAEGAARLGGALDTPAYHRMLAERPGYQEFQDRKWADLSEIMWGTMAVELAHQPDDLPRWPRVALPDARARRRAGRAVRAPARTRWPTRSRAPQLVVIPDAGHSPQFEIPTAWIDALDGLPRRAARPVVTAARRGGARRPARGRGAARARRRHVFTLSGGHLFVLYDGACRPTSGSSTPATSRPRRSRPRAGRRSRAGPGVRGAHRRARA